MVWIGLGLFCTLFIIFLAISKMARELEILSELIIRFIDEEKRDLLRKIELNNQNLSKIADEKEELLKRPHNLPKTKESIFNAYFKGKPN